MERYADNVTIKRVITRCGCDRIIPLCLVYIFYIMLHGHLTPGGGFQGGILTVAVVLLIYLAHGYEETKRALHPNLTHKLEGVALMLYVVLAFVGIVLGASFCQNVLDGRDCRVRRVHRGCDALHRYAQRSVSAGYRQPEVRWQV